MDKTSLIVVTFLDEFKIGHSFYEWPNHITIVPWFDVKDTNNFINQLKSKITGFGSFEYLVGNEDHFGYKKNVVVNKIEPNPNLQKIHNLVLATVTELGTNLDLKYTGTNYTPHISHNEKPFPEKGLQKTITTVTVVRKTVKNGKEKQVLENILL